MPELSARDAVDQILAVLGEAIEGPKQNWSYFTDSGAQSGMLGTLDRLSAAEASRDSGGTTVAAHAHHVVFSLEASAAEIRGDRSPRDWSLSWSISSVDEGAWRQLREDLRSRYADLREAIESRASDSPETFAAAAAVLAHAAYHLGAIRQKTGGKTG